MIEMDYITWLDVDEKIKETLAKDENMRKRCSIEVYPDYIDVVYDCHECETDLKWLWDFFEGCFASWFDSKNKKVILNRPAGAEQSLTIEAAGGSVEPLQMRIRPLFSSMGNLLESRNEKIRPLELPEIKQPQLMAFYSFKGGVGRTVHLTAAAESFLQQHPDKKILIIDSDIEAPGLTWWAQEQNGGVFSISLMDLLVLANDDDDDYRVTIETVAEELQEQMLRIDEHDVYFLPAFRSIKQLLSFPVKPENFISGIERTWDYSKVLAMLGERLKVDFVFIDLRAGLSELTAPILFDPRILRVVVTTASNQSVEGTCLVLHEMQKMNEILGVSMNKDSRYKDIFLLTSMLDDNLRQSDRYRSVQEKLASAYMEEVQQKDDDLHEPVVLQMMERIIDTNFAQGLLNTASLTSLCNNLRNTDVLAKMSSLLRQVYEEPEPLMAEETTKTEVELQEIERLCMEMEYAESGTGREFMHIPAVEELAKRYFKKLPSVVSMGNKGSGKTYLFLQLVRLGRWGDFLQKILPETSLQDTRNDGALLFPFLCSETLQDKAMELVNEQQERVFIALEADYKLHRTQAALREEIRTALQQGNTQWNSFWLVQIGKSLGMQEKEITLERLQRYLEKQNVILLIDGLEDLFSNVYENDAEAAALNSLLGVAEFLREERENHLGYICFVRSDLVRGVRQQNLGQYENLYKAFELKWDFEEALRLVYWLYQKGAAEDPESGDKNWKISGRKLSEELLIPFWGKKLGKNTSREAATSRWVLGALSDFNGQMQARDLVRFIGNAARLSSEGAITYPDRLLQPKAIRESVKRCSQEKIKEITQEYQNIKEILVKLKRHESDVTLPFSREELGLSDFEIKKLEGLGMVKKLDDKYYMPEIFRNGFGFALEKGARPKVLMLMKQSL